VWDATGAAGTNCPTRCPRFSDGPMDLSNRDLAFLIWLAVFAAWVPGRRDSREAVADVFRALRGKLAVVYAAYTLYIVAAVLVAQRLGIWNAGLLKETIAWVPPAWPRTALRLHPAVQGPELLAADADRRDRPLRSDRVLYQHRRVPPACRVATAPGPRLLGSAVGRGPAQTGDAAREAVRGRPTGGRRGRDSRPDWRLGR